LQTTLNFLCDYCLINGNDSIAKNYNFNIENNVLTWTSLLG
jgi:hypothetical protein